MVCDINNPGNSGLDSSIWSSKQDLVLVKLQRFVIYLGGYEDYAHATVDSHGCFIASVASCEPHPTV